MNKSLIKFVTDFGPLLVFFIFYYQSGLNLRIAIPPFILATLVSLIIMYLLERRIPLVPLFSGILITLFGGLTLYFDNKIKNADWIITGEGKLDSQTLSGKAIDGILKSAKSKGIKVATFCGSVDLSQEALQKIGIQYSASIMDKAKNFEDALINTEEYLKMIIQQFVAEING